MWSINYSTVSSIYTVYWKSIQAAPTENWWSTTVCKYGEHTWSTSSIFRKWELGQGLSHIDLFPKLVLNFSLPKISCKFNQLV